MLPFGGVDATIAHSRRIEVVSYRAIDKPPLRGEFETLLASGLRIAGFRHFEKPDGSRWAKEPEQKYTTKQGQVKFQPILGFVDRATAKRFRAQVEEALDRYLAAHSQGIGTGEDGDDPL